ncbi:hypothetical protein ACIHCX_25775 [Streptomyces sp. NPDC052043]|uniref:hypothetical protein n=1 Tax=Streptomyces sp. NPDC052043 TaxID=3365684 RepID=UPI0037D65F7D
MVTNERPSTARTPCRAVTTDPEHAAAAEILRGQAIRQRTSHARARGLAGLAPDDLGVEVEQRWLGSYDRIFTLIEGGAAKEDT